MMNENNIVLENVQVNAQGNITGKVKNAESNEYERLSRELNEHYANDQMVSVIQYTPSVGEMCAGSSNNKWYRVIVRHKLNARNGIIAVCYFVDEGFDATIPVSGLRHLSPKYCKLPHRVKDIFLHGIQPYTMKISEDTQIKYGTSKIWDESAIKFMSDMVTASTEVRCTVNDTSQDGSLSVRMFLRTLSGGLTCLNETMVRLGYAIETGTIQDTKSPESSPKNNSINQPILHKLLKPSQNKMPNARATRSDSEFYHNAADRRHSMNVEDDYDTDNYGISAISHRRFQKSSKNVSSAPGTLSEQLKQKASDDSDEKYLEQFKGPNACGEKVMKRVDNSMHSRNSGSGNSGNSLTPDKGTFAAGDARMLQPSPLGSLSSDNSLDLSGMGRGAFLSRFSSQINKGDKSAGSMKFSRSASCENSDNDVFHNVNSNRASPAIRNRSEIDENSYAESSRHVSESSSRRQSLSEIIRGIKGPSPKESSLDSRSSAYKISPKSVRSAHSLPMKAQYSPDSCSESDTSCLSRNERRKLAKKSPKVYASDSSVKRIPPLASHVTSNEQARLPTHHQKPSSIVLDYMKDNLHGNMSSSNESSSSNLVESHVKGQYGFKTVRLPKDTSDSEYSSQNRISVPKKYSSTTYDKKPDVRGLLAASKSQDAAKSHNVAGSHDTISTHSGNRSHDITRSHNPARSHDITRSHDPARSYNVTRSHDSISSHADNRSHDVIRSHDPAMSHDMTRSHDVTRSHDQTVSGASCDERLIQRIPSPKKAESSAATSIATGYGIISFCSLPAF
ncbi:Tudor domain containing 12 [Mactra antiquata]